MSTLISLKITEAKELLVQSQQEETEGAVLAQKAAEIQRESERYLKSAREKRVIGHSQLEASQMLAQELVEASGEALPAAPAKKRGRPAKATKVGAVTGAAAATLPAAKKGKAAAKEAAEATPKVKRAKKESAAAPKAVRGDKLPPLHDRIRTILGSKAMTIKEIIEGLQAHDKSWVPPSKNLHGYISMVCGTHEKDYFDRVKRGVYKVKKNSGTTLPTGGGSAGGNGNGPVKAKKLSNGIEELGSNVLESPFSGGEVAA